MARDLYSYNHYPSRGKNWRQMALAVSGTIAKTENQHFWVHGRQAHAFQVKAEGQGQN